MTLFLIATFMCNFLGVVAGVLVSRLFKAQKLGIAIGGLAGATLIWMLGQWFFKFPFAAWEFWLLRESGLLQWMADLDQWRLSWPR